MATPAASAANADAASGADAAAPGEIVVLFDVQDVLRQAKQTYISWHTILNYHTKALPLHSVQTCKQFQRCGSFWRCRLVLPNSYAPDDGIISGLSRS